MEKLEDKYVRTEDLMNESCKGKRIVLVLRCVLALQSQHSFIKTYLIQNWLLKRITRFLLM